VIKTVRSRITDLRGVSRMAINAIAGVVSLVETLHLSIAKKSSVLAGPLGGTIEATTAAVYKSIHHMTRAVGAGLDQALGAVGPALRELESSPLREAVVAALNGVLGDYLAESGNPLAIAMHLRRDGKPLVLTSEGIAATVGAPSGKVLVLVHGLCMNDLLWERNGHDHGAALARDLGFTAVYLHYNSGLHVSSNGRELAALLDELIAAWPVPIAELDILAHSMGGLVVRSGHYYASAAARAWPAKLRKIVFLGTPHDGVPLERFGHWLNVLWDRTVFTAPFARLGKVRSAGITDLRHGYVLDEDWEGRDRFAKDAPARRPLALPEGVECYAIAATIARAEAPLREQWLGDGLVPVPSALGRHRDPKLTLAFPAAHQWTAYGANHLDLLSRADVYERIREWLAERAHPSSGCPFGN